jgi:small subunit ribosomal protein S1
MDEVKEVPPIKGEKEGGGTEVQRREETENFQTLYEESFKTIEEGQILRGTVIEITPDHITVDVGYKCEGQIPMQEYLKRNRRLDVKVGDQIDVLIEKKSGEGGMLILSKEKADKINVWKDVSRSCREGEVMEGEIVSR